jgi:methionyl aminopeptidase
VHGIPSAKEKLKEGDIISLDGGVIYDDLYTDACVSVGVGKISEEAQLFLTRSSEILEAVIKEKVKAGVKVGDISSFIQQGLEKHGYSAVKVLTGHGLGDNLHQFPDVPNVGKAGMGPVLPAGTMIAIEPIAVMGKPDVYTSTDQWTVLTKDSSLACHFEHSVLVLDGGYEIIA